MVMSLDFKQAPDSCLIRVIISTLSLKKYQYQYNNLLGLGFREIRKPKIGMATKKKKEQELSSTTVPAFLRMTN